MKCGLFYSEMPAIVLGQVFTSIAVFKQRLAEYEKEQCVPYIVLSSKLAEKYNADRRANGRSEMPEELVWKEATITCKHFGEPRMSEHMEGKERRPNRK